MAVQTSYGTTMPAAFSGQLADNSANECIAMYNGAAAEIAFGRAVKFGAADYEAILPSAETDKIVGIVVHSHAYTKGFTGAELGSTGVVENGNLTVLRKGRIWVIAEDAVTRGDRLWVRAVAGGDPEFLGGLLNADDSTDTIDCTNQGVWLTSASAGGLALLEVDFTGDAT
jgi:hypothetical protein